jgi:SHS2 domain-containing protein
MSGYEEIQHTADWAIKVWSISPEGLFTTALKGMYQLMGVSSNMPDETKMIEMELDGSDLESLLVFFLSECHYYQESNNWQLIPEALSIVNNHLKATMKYCRIISIEKEIKAVTFHNLEINQQPAGLSTILVFDV